MADIDPTIPAVGQLNSVTDPLIRTALQELVATVNNIETENIEDDAVTEVKLADSAVTADKVAASEAGILGLGQTGAVRRGKCIVATEESRNSTYGLLTTPDRVSDVVLPTDGLIAVLYKASWKTNAAAAACAAIFLDAVQVTVPTSAGGSTTAAGQAAALPSGSSGSYHVLSTHGGGLISTGAGAYTGDVTTGQVAGLLADDEAYVNTGSGAASLTAFNGGAGSYVALGGPCFIHAAAGTYDVSVQFTGNVSVKDRKLWVWTLGF